MKVALIFLILMMTQWVAPKAIAATESEALWPAEKAAAAEAIANSKNDASLETKTETKPETKPTKTQAETEIPLNFEANKKAATSEGMAGKVLYSIAVLLLLGGGLIYFVRRYSLPKNAKTPTQIKILSQHHFGPKRSLALVRVAGESILIGITDQNINLVKSLSLLDEDVPEEMPQNFAKTLKQKNQDQPEALPASAEMSAEEDFAISGIKDIVHRRLKSMRTFQ